MGVQLQRTFLQGLAAGTQTLCLLVPLKFSSTKTPLPVVLLAFTNTEMPPYNISVFQPKLLY